MEAPVAGFERYQREVQELEHEIAVRLQVLHVDHHDAVALKALALEAMHSPEQCPDSGDWQAKAKFDLFGLSALMLKTMAESADQGIELHGGPVWKAFGKALWEASDMPDSRV